MAEVDADGTGPLQTPPSSRPASAAQPAAALRSESIDDRPGQHNLVTSLEPLVGREVELERIAPGVAAHRLVTILGTGGIGKTR